MQHGPTSDHNISATKDYNGGKTSDHNVATTLDQNAVTSDHNVITELDYNVDTTSYLFHSIAWHRPTIICSHPGIQSPSRRFGPFFRYAEMAVAISASVQEYWPMV